MIKNIVSEGIWVAAGQLLSAIAALFSIRLLTELLPREQFGELTLYIGAAALAQGLSSTPILQSVFRYYPDWVNKGMLLTLRDTSVKLIDNYVILATFIMGSGGLILSFFIDVDWYIGFIVSLLLVVDAKRSNELAYLNAARNQRNAAILQVIDGWVKPIFALIVVLIMGSYAIYALTGYIIGSATVVILLTKCSSLFDNPAYTIRYKTNTVEITTLKKNLKTYALPLIPLGLFGWFSGMGDRYILASILNLSEVGLYAASYGLASRAFLMFSGIVELTFRPNLQNAISEENTNAIQSVKSMMIWLTIFGCGVGVLLFTNYSELLTNWFVAESYGEVSKLLPWIALGYAIYGLSMVYSRFCYAFDATKYSLYLTVAGSIVGILLLIPFALIFGLAGAVLAIPIRFTVELILAIVFAKRAERNYYTTKSILVRAT